MNLERKSLPYGLVQIKSVISSSSVEACVLKIHKNAIVFFFKRITQIWIAWNNWFKSSFLNQQLLVACFSLIQSFNKYLLNVYHVDIKQCKKYIKISNLMEITKRIFILFSHPETPHRILNSYKIYLFIWSDQSFHYTFCYGAFYLYKQSEKNSGKLK